MAREFHLGDILSISTGCLVSPRHMEGIYDILNYMTGDNLFTHQLPRASDECQPYLLEQMPWLVDVELGADAGAEGWDWEAWLLCQVAEHGEYHPVHPIPIDDHDVIDPIVELERMMPNKPIIVVTG